MERLKDVDPLLAIAKVLVIFLQVVTGIAVIAVLIAIPVVMTQHDQFAQALSEGASNLPLWQGMAAIALFLLAVAVLVASLFWFFRLLGRIIDTVGARDPFTPENAHRLWVMGWIALGVQVGSFLIEALGYFIGTVFPSGVGEDNWHFTVDGDFVFSGNGIVLAVVLFILSRVFRKGAEMRDDLEGTV